MLAPEDCPRLREELESGLSNPCFFGLRGDRRGSLGSSDSEGVIFDFLGVRSGDTSSSVPCPAEVLVSSLTWAAEVLGPSVPWPPEVLATAGSSTSDTSLGPDGLLREVLGFGMVLLSPSSSEVVLCF